MQSEFLISAFSPKQIPQLPLVMMVGRANAGKSTLISGIAARRNLAISSRMPGRTRSANIYRVGSTYFCDLPGFGYSVVSRATQEKWAALAAQCASFAAAVVAVQDVRRPVEDIPSAYLRSLQVPIHVVMTKTDKVSQKVCAQQRASLDAAFPDAASIHLVSNLHKRGIDLLRKAVLVNADETES